jgi:hypothetical protein
LNVDPSLRRLIGVFSAELTALRCSGHFVLPGVPRQHKLDRETRWAQYSLVAALDHVCLALGRCFSFRYLPVLPSLLFAVASILFF